MQNLSEILSGSFQKFSDRPAVQEPNGSVLSYAQLWQNTQSLAAQLAAKDKQVIGVLIPKSGESLTAILSILESGHAYVPLDTHAPATRNALILSDCQADALLIAPQLVDSMREQFSGDLIVEEVPGFDFRRIRFSYDEAGPKLPEDLAYMLYTSGSTGKPKGVLITHRNALSFIEWCMDTFPVSQEDVFSSIAPFHFDLSIHDIYVSLLAGGSLVLIDQKAAKNPMLLSMLIDQFKISILYATPTLLRLVLSYGRIDRYDHTSLRIVHFAGEVFPIEPLRQLKSKWPNVAFYNLYGPTETNVVTWFPIPDQISETQTSPFPIGKACRHIKCAIDDDGLKKPGPGVSGELLITGESVARGYLNRPERTSTSFIQDEDNRIWYRTGDLVTTDDTGNLLFNGRIDRMVKRRGYRIELGEIESALAHHPSVIEAGVIARSNEKEETEVIAWLGVEDPENPPSGLELKEACLKHIPMYMLPDSFRFLKSLPQTSTQKVDYQALKTASND
ncbi:MAG: amino acid adenylation domain-containing protein [Bacteroidetes bacterium]|nr:amino acid adenylation domain-containing protein [Bacteroidota bacterium]